MDPIAGWSRVGGKSYFSTAQPWDLGDGNNQVFVDWQMMNEARWPNSSFDPSHPATAVVTGAYSAVVYIKEHMKLDATTASEKAPISTTWWP